MIEPIRLTFDVECPVEHAFDVWTGRIAQWWPRDHTVSGEDGLTVVLERRPGGRIFERQASGVEHDWGEVTVWEPPTRLGYTWHLNRDAADATDVEIRFVARDASTTTGRNRAHGLGTSRGRGPGLARPERRRLGDAAAPLRRGGEPAGQALRAEALRPYLERSLRFALTLRPKGQAKTTG